MSVVRQTITLTIDYTNSSTRPDRESCLMWAEFKTNYDAQDSFLKIFLNCIFYYLRLVRLRSVNIDLKKISLLKPTSDFCDRDFFEYFSPLIENHNVLVVKSITVGLSHWELSHPGIDISLKMESNRFCRGYMEQNLMKNDRYILTKSYFFFYLLRQLPSNF